VTPNLKWSLSNSFRNELPKVAASQNPTLVAAVETLSLAL
jgi:hypothetical protein